MGGLGIPGRWRVGKGGGAQSGGEVFLRRYKDTQ